MRSKQILKTLLLFILGGAGYFTLEILYRGHSHWSMAICGGVCLVLIHYVNKRIRIAPLAVRAFIGALIITCTELITGCIVNIWLKWNVWSYSNLKINFLGQISLRYSLMWLVLSGFICILCSFTEKRLLKLKQNKQKT